MTGSELRKKFLEFFRSKQHTVVASDSLVPANDPSLLFTGAGMNQFKDNFLGVKRDLKRAASCQKCVRTGDVDEVGKTASHLTFFEMLGNFSFGDYFKPEAIAWGWEFLTKELKIPAAKLCISVYESDEEAAAIWVEKIGLAPDRIFRFGAKDNFWPSNAPADGPNGPCGPCSEIYFDYGRSLPGKICPDEKKCNPACKCGRFVEVWNLVFTQFDRQPDGSLPPLPAKNIDTGMGLERLTAVMQDKMAVFETDLFEPIVAEVRKLASGSGDLPKPILYVIADHARALTFLIGDGVIPSNEKRGYVVRKLLRKAVGAGRTVGINKPFLHKLIPAVIQIMKDAYPELESRQNAIAQTILSEEERFIQTLEQKMPLLEEEIRSLKEKVLPADRAARFYDTNGLPYELIAERCRQENVKPPSEAEFEKALEELQVKSRSASGFSKDIFAKDKLAELLASVPPTRFLGYEVKQNKASKILCLVENEKKVDVVLDATPFYGESGGQVGDTGLIKTPDAELKVTDTQWVGKVLVHRAELVRGKIREGDLVSAEVDQGQRQKTARNHTATHLLHAALRKVLGEHVIQAGSLVAPDRLRFDFSHSKALTASEKQTVEEMVNGWVKSGFPVSVQQMPVEQAKKSGAMALFGEKYAADVRVVSVGGVSKELCGGTHLSNSDEIGLVAIVGEGSVAAGMRRIEALTGEQAQAFLKAETVRQGEEKKRLAQHAKEKEQEAKIQKEKVKEAQDQVGKLKKERIGPFDLFAIRFDQPMDHSVLRPVADSIRKSEPEAVIFLTDSQGFCLAVVGPQAQKQGVSAGQLIKLGTQIAGGSGGGKADIAQGRLKEPSKVAELFERMKQTLLEGVKT